MMLVRLAVESYVSQTSNLFFFPSIKTSWISFSESLKINAVFHAGFHPLKNFLFSNKSTGKEVYKKSADTTLTIMAQLV